MAKLLFSELSTLIDFYLAGQGNARKQECANLALMRIAREMAPIKRTTFTTTPQETTGTVAITQGLTALVGTTTNFDQGTNLYVDGLIQIGGDDTWFGVPTITDDTNIVISSEWAVATVTVATFTLVQPFVVLPGDVLDIIKIGQPGRERLQRINSEQHRRFDFDQTAGTPTSYILVEYNDVAESGTATIQLFPAPDDYYAFTLTYRMRPTLFASASPSQSSDYPEHFNDMILHGTLAEMFLQQDREQSLFYQAKFERALDQSKATQFKGYSSQHQIFDSRPSIGPRDSLPIGG